MLSVTTVSRHCLFLWAAICPVHAETASYRGGAAAREGAVAFQKARADAVAGAAQARLSLDIEREALRRRREAVLARIDAEIVSVDTVFRVVEPDSTVRCTVSVTIEKEDIVSVLKDERILVASMPRPQVLVLAQPEDTAGVAGAMERAMIGYVTRDHGFDALPAAVSNDTRTAGTTGDSAFWSSPSALAAAGARKGADVVVAALASNRGGRVGGSSGTRDSFYTGSVRCIAVDCVSKRIIADSDASLSPAPDGQASGGKPPARVAASVKAVKRLLDPLMRAWLRNLEKGMKLQVTVAGVKTLHARKGVIRTFESMSEVTALKVRAWDKRQDFLILDISFKGTAGAFCSRVDGYKVRTGSGSLAVTGLQGDRVSIIFQAI